MTLPPDRAKHVHDGPWDLRPGHAFVLGSEPDLFGQAYSNGYKHTQMVMTNEPGGSRAT